jgi:hypothetical protein
MLNDEIAVSTMSAPASIAFIRLTIVTPVVEWTWTWTMVSSPHASLIPRTMSKAGRGRNSAAMSLMQIDAQPASRSCLASSTNRSTVCSGETV